jgi:uncharacterized protein
MSGLQFVDQVPVITSAPNRTDIACFIGFVNRRVGTLSPQLERWLDERGWLPAGEIRLVEAVARNALPSNVDLDAATNRLQVALDGRTQIITLPVGTLTPSEIVSALNSVLRGGYARLTDDDHLVIGSDSEGAAASVAVRRQPRLGFADHTNALGINFIVRPVPDLLNIPVPIDTWEVFDQLFAWERRVLDARGRIGVSYMGAAVRSFFAQGGRKCTVVRVGDPSILYPTDDGLTRDERMNNRIAQLIPGFPFEAGVSAADPQNWAGIGHLFGLPDVSFLCMPDLADIVAAPPEFVEPIEPLPSPDEDFVECSTPEAPSPDTQARFLRAPRCDEIGYATWARAINITVNLIARELREVQLVAAVPIPETGSTANNDLLNFLVDGGYGPLAAHMTTRGDGISSAFVQLAYPWVKSAGSRNLPEQLETPDAVLVGVLSRSALLSGAYRSTAGLHLADVHDVYPSLRRNQVLKSIPDNPSEKAASHTLLERVSLLGPTPRGLEVLSDVTTSMNEGYRLASVNRLVSLLVRASRQLGEDITFEPSGEELWGRIRDQIGSLLLSLWHAGALRGKTPDDAFSVRCDRSTMTQNDIDNGKVIVSVQFDPAIPIEQITVVLALAEGGHVSLVGEGGT